MLASVCLLSLNCGLERLARQLLLARRGRQLRARGPEQELRVATVEDTIMQKHPQQQHWLRPWQQ